jgi:hypothetical protein
MYEMNWTHSLCVEKFKIAGLNSCIQKTSLSFPKKKDKHSAKKKKKDEPIDLLLHLWACAIAVLIFGTQLLQLVLFVPYLIPVRAYVSLVHTTIAPGPGFMGRCMIEVTSKK